MLSLPVTASASSLYTHPSPPRPLFPCIPTPRQLLLRRPAHTSTPPLTLHAPTGGMHPLALALPTHNPSGALSQLVHVYPDGTRGTDWAAGGMLGSLVYNVYTEEDYDTIWASYAFEAPHIDQGFVQDISKWQLGRSWNRSIEVQVRC